jgi:hypothetical protein
MCFDDVAGSKRAALGVGDAATQGRAVQVDPVKPVMKPPGSKHLKLKCDILLSHFAFKSNLRRYNKLRAENSTLLQDIAAVNRGRAVQVDPIKPKLKPPGTKRLKLNCDALLSTSAFKLNLRRYTAGARAWRSTTRSWCSACSASSTACGPGMAHPFLNPEH